jgi:CheY-like chemotaxis protein
MSSPYRVVFLGFSDLERETLVAAFRADAGRSPAYGLAAMLSDTECDLVVADADHPPSVQLVLAEDRLASTVFVGEVAPPDALAWLARPVDPLLVMRELDGRVAAQEPAAPAAAQSAIDSATALRPRGGERQGRRARGPVRSQVGAEPGPAYSDSLWPEAVLHPPDEGPGAHADAPAHPLPTPRPDPAGRASVDASAPWCPGPSEARSLRPLPPAVPTLVRAAEVAESAPMMLSSMDLDLPLGKDRAAATPARARSKAGRPPGSQPDPQPGVSGLLLQSSRRTPEPPLPIPQALIVDDSEIAREFLGQRLHRLGLRCDLVAGSAQALEQLARSDYDYVFLDVDLGPQSVLDGLMLCQHIKRHPRVAGAAPPVVAMVSAHSGHLERARGTLAGCDAFLGKPLDEAALLRLLRGNGMAPPRPRISPAHP